uniref:Uncharacterized protein n=1 Tax=Anas zonorhyncha TaxID=75864 RepID=A0A8B9VCW9_9AVES
MNSPTLAEGVRAATSLRGQAGFPWVSSQGGLSVCSSKPPALHGSYWLDLWLFVLFDLALFVFIYLLP